MRCKKVKSLFYDYLNGELKPEEKNGIENHLKTCSECKHEFEIVKQFYVNIEPAKIEAPPELVLKIRDRIETGKNSFLEELFSKLIYPATLVFGISLGIIVANLLYNQNDYERTITQLNNNTIIVEPYMDLTGGIDEQ